MKTEKTTRFKTLKIVGDVIGYLVIFAIVGLLAFVFISRATGHTVFIFGKTTAWVMTQSMEPEIPAQSFILVRKAEPSEVKVGDVIIFSSDDPYLESAYNTHRVIEIIGNGEEFVTKGDANSVEDHYTAKGSKLLGIYEKNLPFLTAWGRFLFSGIGKLIAVAAILGVILLMYVPGIKKANKKRSEEIERKREEQIESLVREEVEKLKAKGFGSSQPDGEQSSSEVSPAQEASPGDDSSQGAAPDDESNNINV